LVKELVMLISEHEQKVREYTERLDTVLANRAPKMAKAKRKVTKAFNRRPTLSYEDLEKKIVQLVKKHDGLSKGAICDKAGVGMRRADEVLKTMLKEKVLSKETRKVNGGRGIPATVFLPN
jgi:ribosomal protein S25